MRTQRLIRRLFAALSFAVVRDRAGTPYDAAGGMRLRYDGGTNTWSISVAAPTLHVTLRRRPEKPYVLHGGGTGVIEQSSGGLSHYSSDTRMRAAGTLRAGGRQVRVTGESWFDHQWGDYADDSRAFDWNWVVPTFWEGAARATGSRRGTCFVEVSYR